MTKLHLQTLSAEQATVQRMQSTLILYIGMGFVSLWSAGVIPLWNHLLYLLLIYGMPSERKIKLLEETEASRLT